MYWLENVFFISGFFVFDACIAPFAYCKVWFNIITNSNGLLTMISHCIIWAFIGPPVMMFLLCKDTALLTHFLSFHTGCKEPAPENPAD
jgi:hypothetical protein